MTAELVFDVVLMLAVLVVAYRAIHGAELFGGIVHYIGYGLLLSLVWVRLGAPDLALVEAAIGAGVTGALLLDAAAQLGRTPRPSPTPMGRGGAYLMITTALVLALIAASLSIADRSPGVSRLVSEALPRSGVEHPVTAILLNFRGYDTWLEVGVLFAAGLGILAIRSVTLSGSSPEARDPLLQAASTLLIPFALLVAGYLLWRGTHAPGGAFQGGAVVAAALILLTLSRTEPVFKIAGLSLQILLSGAFLLFAITGAIPIIFGRSFLEYGPTAGTSILVIETIIVIATAVTLTLIFVGSRPSEEEAEVRER